MKKSIVIIFLCLLFFLPCRDASGIVVNLAEKDVADAIREGKEKGSKTTKYLKQKYSFGKEGVFEEDGIIRTKWSKLVLFSSLLAAKGKTLTEQEKKRVLTGTDLQIDIHTFGNTIDFAMQYKIHLIQKGRIIEPEKVSANHVTYRPKKKIVTSGFPKYTASIRSFFSYAKINPDEKAEIVLVKNKKKVVFEVDFKDYR